MNSRRDYRSDRTALFDGIEEGGIRAYSSHEIDEHENERAIDGLQDRVNTLKRMSPTKEVRYTSRSITPPPKQRSRSISPPRTRARSHSRSQDSVDASNPGNNLYITGLSTRVTSSYLEKYFSKEGKVLECQVVTDPHTRESRGFAFITMDTVEDAERCIKYLNRSVLEGRLITVEKAKRRRGRTPTPGKYCGSRERRDRSRKRSRSHSPYRARQRDRSHSRSRRERSRSPYSRDSHRRRRERSMSAASGDNH